MKKKPLFLLAMLCLLISQKPAAQNKGQVSDTVKTARQTNQSGATTQQKGITNKNDTVWAAATKALPADKAKQPDKVVVAVQKRKAVLPESSGKNLAPSERKVSPAIKPLPKPASKKDNQTNYPNSSG